MSRRYYKVDLVMRALHQQSMTQAARLVFQITRGYLFGRRQIVFAMNDTDVSRVPPPKIDNFEVETLAGWTDVRRLLYEPLEQERYHLPMEPEEFCRRGACFWVGRIDGEIAAAGLSRIAGAAAPYFLPVQARQAVLSHFVTLPQYRGKGLYAALLSQILHNLKLQGVEHFLIDCSDWNVVSRRVIERIGFRPIGRGVIKRNGQLLYYPSPYAPKPAAVPACMPD